MNLPLSFWDTMAKNYPRYNEPSMQKDVQHVLQWASDQYISFEKCTILDIGCGTGTFAIPLAQKSSHVTALDVCESMLNALHEDATHLQLSHAIQTHQTQWDTFPLQKSYDIVIASMTPAISSEALIEKMIQATHNIGLYVGWGSYKINAFVDALMRAHKIPEKTSGGGCVKIEQFTRYLEDKSIPYKCAYFETSWSDTYAYDEAVEYALNQLQRKNVTPDRSIIDTLIQEFTCNETITIETRAEKGMVLFQKTHLLPKFFRLSFG